MRALVVRSYLDHLSAYEPIWQAMQAFTRERNTETADEIWLVNHQPVFTLGRNGKPEHILDAGTIPVVPIDRGGQVTYHGPGQLVMYLLLDLKRLELGVRDLVMLIENSIIQLLKPCGVIAQGDREAPGVYVSGRKIAALGLRVSRGCTYHGLSLNVNMDLSPFQRINPCGYAGLEVTQCADLGVNLSLEQAAQGVIDYLSQELNYTHLTKIT
ncbi:MAG: lipoyl(octanoyl) transferase LipB [Thiofilum sp.]|uniref:lipoyl(octanoyl) transferase LipB n=1 Tax=Thiofilum sp. TaxID=2212733 RepID=UPI0025D655B7|nr:lipoyl(octanoyl) transferase LipB [Thiofilum sp.]MBK8452532.1 lipoyl(octanoyl) transferase LipB [Thiofilum sp.]